MSYPNIDDLEGQCPYCAKCKPVCGREYKFLKKGFCTLTFVTVIIVLMRIGALL